jgi:hemoglobin-like flavoprotein
LKINELTPKELFLQSVGRCLASEAFIPAFYDRFLSASDEIKNKFRFTDFDKQNAMLRRSLELAAGATSGDPESLREISARAETHDRYHLNVEPRLYDIWLETIIETARDYDANWSEVVEASWRSILGHVVQHMVRKY